LSGLKEFFMVYGIGIDLVENERMERIIQKWGDRFLARVFSPGEIAYCSRHAQASLHYGARFAAKEAFLKGDWQGVGAGVNLLDIEVENEKSGRPRLILSGGARTCLDKACVENVHLSISHTKRYATALVVLE